MAALLMQRSSAILLLLLLATGAALWFGAGEKVADANNFKSPSWAILLVIAFFKARLILMEFMEVREAPSWLRRSAEAWVILTCAVLVGHPWIF